MLGQLFTMMWFILLITITCGYWLNKPLMKLFKITDYVLYSRKVRIITIIEAAILFTVLCLMFATKR